MNIQEALRRAKGSEVLSTVLIGMRNAEEWMMRAADHIDNMEAVTWELEGRVDTAKVDLILAARRIVELEDTIEGLYQDMAGADI